MNCIYLDGHTYSPDDLRALVADRDAWQRETLLLRTEYARLIKAEAESHDAIVLLATENAATAAPEALLALDEAMEADPEATIERLTAERDAALEERDRHASELNEIPEAVVDAYVVGGIPTPDQREIEQLRAELSAAREEAAVADSVAGDLMNEKANVLRQLSAANEAQAALEKERAEVERLTQTSATLNSLALQTEKERDDLRRQLVEAEASQSATADERDNVMRTKESYYFQLVQWQVVAGKMREAAQGVAGYLIVMSDGSVTAESPIPAENLRTLECALLIPPPTALLDELERAWKEGFCAQCTLDWSEEAKAAWMESETRKRFSGEAKP